MSARQKIDGNEFNTETLLVCPNDPLGLSKWTSGNQLPAEDLARSEFATPGTFLASS